MKILAALISILMLCVMPDISRADSTDDTANEYIRVEVKGTLNTGVMAIGAETTGTTIRANNVTWELDFGDRKDLKEQALKLDKKRVVVTGTYEKRRGVEIRDRHIVKVTAIRAAE